MRSSNKPQGFTLVELSIVLVILGLLIGGVLTGQSLIRAAELRSVTAQYSRYVTAVHTFRDKYFAIPGDMTNAQSYWGVQDATPATCVTSASSDAKTCNGDGNGMITVATGSNEQFRFWQHLANAGLIEGSYDGVQHGTNVAASNTLNAPSGRISSSLWWVNNFGSQTSGTYGVFDGDYGNVLQFGGMTTNGSPVTAILKPEEMYNIDTKLDDGKPATGKVVMRVSSANVANCTDGANSTVLTANYLLTNTAAACAAMFRQAF